MSSGAWGGFGGGAASSLASGLPFAGIPPELAARVEKVLEDEPKHKEIKFKFSHVVTDWRPLTLWRFVAPHWLALSLAFILIVFEILAQQAGPLLTKIGIDQGILPRNTSLLFLTAAGYLAAVVVNGLASYGRVTWTGRVGEQLMLALRLRVFSHLQRLSIDFFTKEKAGRVMTRMTSDIEALSVLFHEGMINLIVQGLTMIVVTAVLFSLNVKLAAITVLLVIPALAVLTIWFKRASDRGYGIVRERIADILADFQESLTGIRIITAFNRQRYNLINHHNVVGEYRDSNLYTAKLGAIYSSGSDLIGLGGRALILLIGGRMLLNGNLSLGELTAFVLYLTAFFAPIQQLVQLYNTYQQGQAALIKLRDLLAIQPGVPEAPNAEPLPPIKGEISIDRVTFGYDPEQTVLRDVSLTIRPGETFALVGETGAGKSTLAKLIIRFYDPNKGRVLIDGHDLKGVTLESLRGQLGYVPQEPFLFAGTIRDNISFARPDAATEDVMKSCQAVGIDDLINSMPNGLNSICHERGTSLSSGERQLLALARAFLARPRVIVLDEATSNLDLASEAKIECALDALLESRTAIIIAHRLTTAMRADRIAVIDDGRIAELGSHDELLALNGRYADMYAAWIEHA
ncbi:MAG: ABC transporter ATP-binding protein, partial [Deltaproteobacteria bacterium]|nr:ABC transporter ATP-binding protein [Deltaproteobacteria bacterium]MBW2052434.1 ABC transporter ATP-binding protein [Deltaproteobacteria bacterium]MBW2324428.1 ABC transporter ATP-binding protein [Deltaproteobacteria bacterium]